MSDTSVSPCMPLVPFKLLPQCWSSEGLSLNKSMCWFFKRNCLGLLHWLNPHWFLQPEIVGTYLSGTGILGWGGLLRGWDHPEFFKIYFIFKRSYSLLERGEEKDKERVRNINLWLPYMSPLLGTWSTNQVCSLTGNWTGDLWVCSPVLNPLSHTSQGSLSNLYPPCVGERPAHSASAPLLPVWMDVVSSIP